MYKYRLKEDSYTPSGFEVGDVEIARGKKSTVTDVDPLTGAVTWEVENIAAFESIYKTFDKLRGLLKTLEREGEAKDDTTVDFISSETNDLFNKFRTHVRKTYPEAYKRLLRLKEESVNEAKKVDAKTMMKMFKNKADWGDTADQVYMKGGKMVYVDTWFYGQDRTLKQLVNSWKPGGHNYDYWFKTYGVKAKITDTFGEVQATGRHKKLTDGGIVGVVLDITPGIMESVNEGWMDDIKNYIDKFFEDHRSRVPEGQKHLVVYFDEFINWTKENRVPKNLVTSLLQRISNEEGKGFLIDIDFGPLEEEEGIGYMTPKSFDKNKKSTGANDIYYYKLGYKPVPKKIKGAGTIVKKLWEKESLNEFSDFQQKRINSFDGIEENLNTLSPLLSNAKSETTKYYNENPGSYDIVYSTDMIEDYVNNIIELLKQEEE